ncbi:hypothetical protein J3Q64DRAFT_1729586 [Phycomyces blakesleeanus]|uniref:CCDC43 PWI-like domain-containing protein n=1 Tax=Phycomyces blakesleeanus TaxID=4837 RepID=A0ABR3B573_PHYBL
MSLVDQVAAQLEKIQLKDDDISEYIAGIVQEDSLEEEEKREAISEFISETTDKPTDEIIDNILNEWKKMHSLQEKSEAELKAKQTQEIQEREKARQAEQEKLREEEKQLAALNRRKELSKEEREKRERLLQQYSYGAPETSDSEQTATEAHPKDKRVVASQDHLLVANRNADVIKEQEAFRREQMRHESELEKERNKMLQKKQKQDKEKEKDKDKKRTMKKEKRRM